MFKKNKKIFGIDMSLNHTGMCSGDSTSLKYYSITREDSIPKKTFEIIKQIEELGYYININIDKNLKFDNYSDDEYRKVKDANNLTNIITSQFNDEVFVGIEGFSFGSKGQSIIDIAGMQYILRSSLYNNSIPFKILSPSTIKKTAGKGNLNKEGMFKAYLDNVTKDERLNDCTVYNFILNNLEKIHINNKTIREPFCGMIDSYFIVRTLEQEQLKET